MRPLSTMSTWLISVLMDSRVWHAQLKREQVATKQNKPEIDKENGMKLFDEYESEFFPEE